MLKKFFAAVFAIFLLAAGTAYATPDSAEAPPKVDNPFLPALEKKTEELGAKLTKPALEHLYYVREGFGVTRAVNIVRRDVSDAVKACGKDNPDMKADIEGRFSQWTGKVDPVVKQKESEINAAISDQGYAKSKEIKDYLKLIEQAADYANRNIDKQIVTTPEACKDLMESMEKTGETVTSLLSEMKFLPWPPVEGAPDTGKADRSTAPN